MKTQTNMSLSTGYKAIPAILIMLASDEECNQVIANCKKEFFRLQGFMSNINLLEKDAIGELLIVTNCTKQLKEMMINCAKRLDKSVSTNTATDVYTTTKAHEGRKRG